MVTSLCREGDEGGPWALISLDRVSLTGLAAAFEDLGAHVAALFGPLVGLLGQHHADQADDRVAVGEDPHDVGAPADLLVQPLLRVVRPYLTLLANA